MKRKFYFDNEYNMCTCVEARDFHRIPAEKPFEGRQRRNNVNRRRNDVNREREQIPYGYRYEYKPKLKLSFEQIPNKHVNPKGISSESTEDGVNKQRRTISGQYPCFCVQPQQYHISQPIPHYESHSHNQYFEPCQCGCMYKKCEDPRCSYPKRAWNMVKSTTKSILKSKQKRSNEDRRERERALIEYFEGCGNPYVYPYPVPYGKHIPRKKHKYSKTQSVGTRLNQQSINSSPDDVSYTEDEYQNQPKVCPLRRKEVELTSDYYRESPTKSSSPPEPIPKSKCCCVCDVDFCDCRCCCTGQCDEDYMLDIHRNTQTSIQNIKERFTQTDFPKRCCRCCKCCARKSKCYTTPVPSMPANKGTHWGKCIGCETCMYKNGVCPPTPNFQCRDGKKNSAPNEGGNQEQEPTKEVPKTQMVKTNSVQCIPILENKATSCDEPFYSNKMNDIMRDLWDGKYDGNYNGKYDVNYDGNYNANYDGNYNSKLRKQMGDIPFYKTAIEWTNNFLQSMTPRKRKSKNFFLDDGIFSSPLTGKQYNLNTPEVDLSPKIIKKNLPKPLNLNDDIFSSTTSKKLYNSYGEHNQLITAICEAILKKHDDDLCIGNSQFICKDDLSSDQDLHFFKENPTQKLGNKKNQKTKMMSKLISKPMFLKSKTTSKSTLTVDNSNTRRIGLIPVRINKKFSGKTPNKRNLNKINIPNVLNIPKMIEESSEYESEVKENFNNKKALNEEVSNFEGIDYFVSESRDLYQNLQNKHFSTQERKENDQKSNPLIDYDRLKNLDFSNLKFTKPEMNASEYFRQKYINQKNFILNNLPSYSSSISNEYQIKSLLSQEKLSSNELLKNTSSPLLQRTPSGSSILLEAKNNMQYDLGGKLNTLSPRQRKVEEFIKTEIKDKIQENQQEFNFFGKKK